MALMCPSLTFSMTDNDFRPALIAQMGLSWGPQDRHFDALMNARNDVANVTWADILQVQCPQLPNVHIVNYEAESTHLPHSYRTMQTIETCRGTNCRTITLTYAPRRLGSSDRQYRGEAAIPRPSLLMREMMQYMMLRDGVGTVLGDSGKIQSQLIYYSSSMVRRRLLTLPNMYPLLRVWFRKSSSMRLLLGLCWLQFGASMAPASL